MQILTNDQRHGNTSYRLRAFRYAAALMLVVAFGSPVAGQVVNGDFEAGATSFTSDLPFVPPPGPLFPGGSFTVFSSPNQVNAAWCGVSQWPAVGNSLLVDGNQAVVWRQTVTLAPGEYYEFQALAANILCFPNASWPELELRVDGAAVAGPVPLPPNPTQWSLLEGGFIATVAATDLDIFSVVGGAPGNDFAVDNIDLRTPFLRADCNNDGRRNIADPVRLLGFLFPPMFPGPSLPCWDACDANDDGSLNIADAAAMLEFLFPSGPGYQLPEPSSTCGLDPTFDRVGCVTHLCP